MSKGLLRRARLVAALLIVLVATLLPATAAQAHGGHTGDIWFCPTSNPLCPYGVRITPVAGGAAYVNGAGLLASRSDIAIRYAPTANPPNNACDVPATSTILASGVVTNSFGNVAESVPVTVPGPGNWNFCATNGSGHANSNHLVLIVTVAASTTPVALGPNHALSVKTDGRVFAWGQNNYGQLGNGTTANSPANPVPGLTAVASVAAGDDFSVALKTDGTVWAWGRNHLGQTGDGWGNDSAEEPWVTSPVASLALEGMTGIAAGCTHALALGTDGAVWGWGDNSSGQLGHAGGGLRPVRVHVPGVSGVTAIAAGCGWSMAAAYGQVYTWGANTSGQLGDGTTTPRHSPAPVPGLSGVSAIGAGRSHALAVVGGSVQAWGRNNSGQLGNNTSGGILTTPVAVANLSGVTSVAGGSAHSVARTSSGQAWAWGANTYSQLGNNSTTASAVPVRIASDAAGTLITGATVVAAGGNSTATATAGGNVRQTGNHFDGTTCRYAMDQPGTGPTTAPAPGPRPPSQAPNPTCQSQGPTPAVLYGPLNAGRATSASRVLNSASIATTPRPTPTYTPEGFPNPNPPPKMHRSHLLAHIFGGVTTGAEGAETNIVALYEQANRQPTGMRRYEREIQSRLVKQCETIQYTVTAEYGPGGCPGQHCWPNGVRMRADGNQGFMLDCFVVNSTSPPVCAGH